MLGQGSIRRFPYQAARAAECAGAQGVFHDYHARLMEDPNWLGGGLSQFAQEVGVADLRLFEECIRDTFPVARIQKDVEAVQRLGGTGTPTIIIDGTLLGKTPSVEDLKEILRAANKNVQMEGSF